MKTGSIVPALSAGLALVAGLAAADPTPRPTGGEREPVDLVVGPGTVLTMDPARRVVSEGAVAIRAGKIVAVERTEVITERYRPARRIDAGGGLILPGLINTHGHAPMVLLRGVASDVRLKDWLEQSIFPAEKALVDPEFVYWGTLLASAEMMRSGTTTFADMYYFEDRIAEAVERAGLRGVLGQTVIRFPAPDYPTPAATLEATARFIERWRDHPRIVPAIAPHSQYLLDAADLQACRRLSDQTGAPILIHLSETYSEVEDSKVGHAGQTPPQYLESLGFLGPRVLAAHCVGLTAEDIELLKRRGTACSHNPESNMKLASGIAPVADMVAAGLTVGLGTDGPAGSNDNLDLFEAMDFAGKLAKVHKMDPTVLPAEQILAMATIEGARALGLADRIGSLEPGKEADLVVVGTAAVHLQPYYSPYAELVYNAKGAAVRHVLVSGEPVVLGGVLLTLDQDELLERARAYRERVSQVLSRQ